MRDLSGQEEGGVGMPRYRYRGVDQNGKGRKGQMAAADEAELHSLLLEQGCYLTWSEVVQEKRCSRPLKVQELSAFSRELGTLLRSGIPLYRALSILSAEEGLRADIRRLYKRLLKLVGEGCSLSQAMEQQNGAFPPLAVHMFQAAQIVGDMGGTALRLADYYSREYKLASKLKSALVYPKLLLVLLVAVTGFLTGFILPQFTSLFSLMEELPLPTRILYGLSGLVTCYWYLAAAGAVAAIWGWRTVKKARPVRRSLDRARLSVPLFGVLHKTVCTARFARTLSSLYPSGVPIELAMRTAGKTMENVYIEEQLERAAAMVESGCTLSEALETVDGFLQKLAAAVKVGEEAGSLETMLSSMAEHMEYEAELTAGRMTAYLEPLAIIVMALVVGFVMIGVMLPIYGSYDAIESMGI